MLYGSPYPTDPTIEVYVSAAGWVAMHRKAFNPGHALAPTNRHPASNLHAWLDLCQMATHRPTLGLKRGEMRISVRFLADRWKWDRCRAERFLKRLKSETAIETVSETPTGTIYRLVNYDIYNAPKKESETPSETVSETKTKRKQKKQPPLPPPGGEFLRFQKAYPRRHGGQGWTEAQERFTKLVKNGQTALALISKAADYAGYIESTDRTGTKYVMAASSFLGPKKRGYEEDWSKPPTTNGGGPQKLSRTEIPR